MIKQLHESSAELQSAQLKGGNPANYRRWLGILGVGSLGLSTLFLWFSGLAYEPRNISASWSFASLMFIARIFGLGAFVCGVASLALQSWTVGTLLLIGSIALPGIAFVYFGAI
jgi:hypothetical protein